MYNVMLADDDYPVIELLSETIRWEELGLRLMSTHENGWSAWEQAQRQTCHSEFQYAQQAVRLNVQDYLLKDTLDPEDLVQRLTRFKQAMDEEKQAGWEHSRMKRMYDEAKELRKEQSLKNLIDLPLLFPENWRKEAAEYGLLREGEHTLPVAGFLENYRQVKYRFFSDQTLRFAVGNVMKEVLENFAPCGVHAGYDARTWLLFFSGKPGLHRNLYEETAQMLKEIQSALRKVLKVDMSLCIGEPCASPESLKQALGGLLASGGLRFYLEPGETVKLRASRPKLETEPEGDDLPPRDLFSFYDEALGELRGALLDREPQAIRSATAAWTARIRKERYPPEAVKDWVLKLLLDLKLKLQAIPSVSTASSADTLHKEIADIDSLADLHAWLNGHLESWAATDFGGHKSGRRAEITEACVYVTRRLHSRISLDEVAEHLHMNTSYFCRLFKKETGSTFIEYVTRLKMMRAQELLDRTGATVGEICEQLGYDNQSYFIKTFKSYAGVTPVEYRSRLR
ncbi:AraC family transcriptional regulator [Paenibacillus sp. AR247]|uniref:response regulator transcription factor n=1 Tax=Paenibacillus sp. AR247 TaxID=1631599 RepID=UPI000CF97435|nr:helix-turn-helix domain-containing protein [Paenibacillus sp. AR247]PQP86201.1 DNA-binding response regulator [Paenibacillus sp. AR247]